MTNAFDNFESFLRNGLKTAAKDAPDAPSPFVIRQALRRRGVSRAIWTSVAAALVIVMGLSGWGLFTGNMSFEATVKSFTAIFTPQTKTPPVVTIPDIPPRLPYPTNPVTPTPEPVSTPPPVVPPVVPTPPPQPTLVSALQPLTDDANMFELRKSLVQYFAAHGITRAEISKEPGQDLDYILRAKGVIDFAQVTLDIETLLRNFSRASITLKDGDTTCWLLARAPQVH